MALVTIGIIYTDLNLSSIRGKPVDTGPLLYSQIQQQAIEPSEAIIRDVDCNRTDQIIRAQGQKQALKRSNF
jgi:hypothetical protein